MSILKLNQKFKLFNLKKQIRIHYSSFSSNKLIENNLLEINDEIKYTNKPIVALESTIITHGLPYPTNLDMALEVENEIKSHGAVPATIAFLNGKLKVGLNKYEIETIAKKHDESIKISRRDLPYIYSKKSSAIVGGTTVSATMIAAHAANIPIFCTGGIGGVHRDFIDSMDVSADLQELARTPVAVVSSGVKSILDIEKTLEYLETMGVCVVTMNKNGSKEFPSFFTSKSGYEAPYNCSSEIDAANLIDANLKTALNTGLLIAVPIPEQYSADDSIITKAINEALEEAARLKIKGKKVTPFLLDKINKITKGQSLKSNLALIKNNAKVSAKIAVELSKLRNNKSNSSNDLNVTNQNENQVSIIGGTNLDLSFKLLDESTLNINGVTQPAEFTQVLGGVGRNMAEALFRCGVKNSILISALSNDIAGRFIRNELNSIGLDTSKIYSVEKKVSTGSYCAIFGTSGDIKLAVGDMKAHDFINPDFLSKHFDTIRNSELCVLDADIPAESIELICDFCKKENIPVWFNPTDIRKCNKISNCYNKLTYISPNFKEFILIFKNILREEKNFEKEINNLCEKYTDLYAKNIENIAMNDLKIILKYMLKFIPFILLTRGKEDLVLASSIELLLDDKNQLPLKRNYHQFKQKRFEPHLYLFSTLKLEKDDQFMNVSGAGDSNTAGIIAGLIKNYTIKYSIYNGLLSAKYALLTNKNVSDQLSNIDLNLLKSLENKYLNKIQIHSLN